MKGRNAKLKLTTVKVHEDLAENFKIDTIKSNFTLQKLVNRSIYLYLTDENFKKMLLDYNSLNTSGSI
jgi:hypothetical protein